MKYCVLFNPKAGNGQGYADVKKLCVSLGEQVAKTVDVTAVTDFPAFFEEHRDLAIVLCGGDGTLNRFANDIADLKITSPLFYYATGSGNDFMRDIEKPAGEMIALEPYLEHLPTCEINGKTYRYINGIGYGLDGYCCEAGDLVREKAPGKPINYTAIAIKGLLYAYKPVNAKVTVDGKEYRFKKVWIAPTMNGRYYGGGMMATPDQDRLSPDGKQSVLLIHNASALHVLLVFPKIFKGEHVKSKICTVLSGNEITVEFDGPRSLQLDGETMLGVRKHTVRAGKRADKEQKEESYATV